ncbi:MAG: cytochrome-c oxidase [Gammaproteobacteria bacterium]|nr:cytochrome-c oxidase [Gammaproteobacteria bacterium]MDE1887548.1 cytochrome-c oxidase [Gammaproteobacteria bacterium]MDE2024262.1 cytochrome-c oxidase [Gammaproteobacteria bacterium]MDE2274314.1 cytochrome-c oxidase [Gammaproteobacteria bacterium]
MAPIWLKIAVVYLLIGVIFGLVMGISHQFQYAPVHAHVNLLGWATLALAGLIYWLCPRAGGHWLGLVHFWLHNIGLPIFLISLFIVNSGHAAAIPVVAVGATIAAVGILFFTVNLFLNLKKA